MEDFKKIKKRLLRNKEIRKEYERLEPDFERARILIKKRIEKKSQRPLMET